MVVVSKVFPEFGREVRLEIAVIKRAVERPVVTAGLVLDDEICTLSDSRQNRIPSRCLGEVGLVTVGRDASPSIRCGTQFYVFI